LKVNNSPKLPFALKVRPVTCRQASALVNSLKRLKAAFERVAVIGRSPAGDRAGMACGSSFAQT